MTDKKRGLSPKARAELVSTGLDVLGSGLVVAGISLWSVPVALVVAGIAVLLAAHPITIRRG